MTPLDLVNSSFETVFAVLIWLNVRQLLRDRQVHGVSLWVQGFATLYGWWAVCLYTALEMWFSMGAQVVMSLGSSIWLVLALKLKYSSV